MLHAARQRLRARSLQNTPLPAGPQPLQPQIDRLRAAAGNAELQSTLRLAILDSVKRGLRDLDDVQCLFEYAADYEAGPRLLLDILSASRDPDTFTFDLSLAGHSSIEFAQLPHPFPPQIPSTGYTFAAWIKVTAFDPSAHTTIFGAFDQSQSCFLLLYLEHARNRLVLQTSLSNERPAVRFENVTFQPGQWYHIALVHHRPLSSGSSSSPQKSPVSLLVNGEVIERLNCHYPQAASRHAHVQAFLGTPQAIAPRLGPGLSTSIWSLASAHLFSEALSHDLIFVYQNLGPSYQGNFQDALGSFHTFQASANLNLRIERLHADEKEAKSVLMRQVRADARQASPEAAILLSVFPAAFLHQALGSEALAGALDLDAFASLRQRSKNGANGVVLNSAVPFVSTALQQSYGVGLLVGAPLVTRQLRLGSAVWRESGFVVRVLRLVQSAKNPRHLQDAMEAVFALTNASWRTNEVMERENGFGMLSWVLERKLIDLRRVPASPGISRVQAMSNLHLKLLSTVLQYVGYDAKSPSTSKIVNALAFRQLLVDTDIWRRADAATQELYYSQFADFLNGNVWEKFNAVRLGRMRLLKKFIETGKETGLYASALPAFRRLLQFSVKSPDHFRSVAMFVTFSLQVRRSRPNTSASSASRASGSGLLQTHTKPASDGQKLLEGPILAAAILEELAHCLETNDDDATRVFAKSVTNRVCQITWRGRTENRLTKSKWLLDLLDDNSDSVAIAAVRILTKIFAVEGPPYINRFETRTHGFVILNSRLRFRWRLSSIWDCCFAILFGTGQHSWLSTDSGIHSTNKQVKTISMTHIICPAIFAVMTGMFEEAFKSIPTESDQEMGSTTDGPLPEGDRKVIQAAIRELADLFGFLPDFKEFAQKSQHRVIMRDNSYVTELSFTKELIRALYSTPSSGPFPEQEITQSTSSPSETKWQQQPKLPEQEQTGRVPQQRQRSLSFVIVGSQRGSLSTTATLSLPLTPASRKPLPGMCNNAEKRHLRSILCAVFADQILHAKDFTGLGLFLKAPPGAGEHRASISSDIIYHTVQALSAQLDAEPTLYLVPRVLTHLARFISQCCEALYEGWLLGVEPSLLAFAGSLLHYLDRPLVRKVKSVRLCSPQLATIRTEALEIGMFQLMLESSDQGSDQSDNTIVCLMAMQDLILPQVGEDTTLFRALCSLLYRQLWSSDKSAKAHAASLWRSFLAQRPEEVTQALIGSLSKSCDTWKMVQQFCVALQETDNIELWLAERMPRLDDFFAHGPDRDLAQVIQDRNRRSEETASLRSNKRHERHEKWHLKDLANQHAVTEHAGSTRVMTSNIYDSELLKLHRSRQDHHENLEYLQSLWVGQETRMHLLEDQISTSTQIKWQLDESEGKDRMRMRLLPSEQALEPVYQPKRRNPSSNHSLAHGPLKGEATRLQSTTDGAKELDPERMGPQTENQSPIAPITASDNLSEDDFEVIAFQQDGQQESEDKNRKVMRSLQRGETVEDACNVSVIHGLEAVETLLIVGGSSLYLMENLFQCRDGEVVNSSEAPLEERDPYTKTISGQKVEKVATGTQVSIKSQNWPWKDVVSISQRRFLFRDVAVEIFFKDGRSYLFTTATQPLRDSLFVKLELKVQLRKEVTQQPPMDSLWKMALALPQTSKPGVSSLSSKFASVFTTSSHRAATKAWSRGEMSNFQYLMLVNTLAGRTFNDLTQYPVFPWVIADYTSEELDLSNPRSFRDLSKPMGCQSPQRETGFRERYKSFAEMDESTPAFHYGTHYSSAMIVTSYLIRLQPFVKSYLLLQGGTFDHAERLFQSIEKAWRSASQESNSDVRELIPEFFYLPEFLVNINHYNFGAKQGSGEIINNVKLPPWAKGDPAIFIARQREALESPYVSKNLHAWIDLIFGFKQRGEAALEATNVFHHLTYEGAVNLDDIKDEHERISTIGIIHNFGQTPKQVFTRPHEQREDASSHSEAVLKHMESLHRTATSLVDGPEQVKSIKWSARDQRVVHLEPFRLPLPLDQERYLQWGYADHSLRFYASSDPDTPLKIFEQPHEDQLSAVVFADAKTLITASDDNTVALWQVTSLPKSVEIQPKAVLFGHKHSVTHLVVSPAFGTILTADCQGTIFTWDLNRLQLLRRIDHGLGPISCVQINERNGHFLVCTAQTASLYTLNGNLLLQQPACTPKDGPVTCCAFYQDTSNAWFSAEILFTGHENGNVKIWNVVIGQTQSRDQKSCWSLRSVRTLEHDVRVSAAGVEPGVAVTCVTSIMGKVYVGSEDGKVFEWVPVR